MSAVFESVLADCIRSLPQPIDFRQVLTDLRARGWRWEWIAKACNAPPSTVFGWYKERSQPAYEYGRALVALHRRVCGDSLAT